MTRRTVVVSCALSLFLASSAFADAKVTQKTKVQFGGVVGGLMNTFGGKATKDGVTTDIVVKGNRRLARTGSSGELVDLREEKIYTIDYDRKTYKVTTFAEVRKQFEDAQKSANDEGEGKSSSSKKDPNAKEYEVDFDLKETGAKQTINGFNAREVVMTVTVREKGKKLEEAGGSVLTSNMWLAPRVAAMREVENFERKYIEKLWGPAGVDMRSMAAVLASAPAFSKAMKAFQDKKVNMDGTAVRTSLKFETVSDPRAKAEEESGSSNPSEAAARAIGGLMRRMKRDKPQSEAQTSSSKSARPTAAPGRKLLFNSNLELLGATGKAAAEDVAVPTGFKAKG